MSTIASARLAAISVSNNLNNLQESHIGPRPVTSAAASASRAFALYRHTPTTMHPNDLLLQKHGVTSPRLCNVVVADKATTIDTIGESRSPLRRCSEMSSFRGIDQRIDAMDEDNEEDMLEKDDVATAAEDDHVMIDDDDEEDDDTTRRSLIVAATACDGDLVEDKSDDERDAVSLCSSEDSELSVGQEDDPAVEEKNERSTNFLPARRLLLTNVSDMMSLCRPSAFSNVSAGDNGSDARSSVSTDCDATQLDEELTQQQNVRPSTVLDPFTVANVLRMPVPLVPPPRTGVGVSVVPAQFHEELLRKSHLYAEELMKQQMQLMAAARASAFTLRPTGGAPTTAITGASYRPQQAAPNYSGIHSHLSAISKMSQLGAAAAVAAQLSSGGDALAKLTAFGMSGGQINSGVSNLNQLQAQMQAHLPAAYMNNNNINNNNNNNHLHESSLKFSIDNILKADFGRRITDPLLKRGGGTLNCTPNGSIRGGGAAARTANSARNRKSNGGSSRAAATTTTTPMDLTSQMTAAVSSVVGNVASNFSTSLANICTNSNDSSSTAVSSTYGGNSDALKSPCSLTGGAASVCSVSPAPPIMGGSTEVSSKQTQDNAAGDGNGGAASSSSSTSSTSNGGGTGASGSGPIVWPAWVYCTRYSDRPSSGPRARKPKKPASEKGASPPVPEDKRPRTAFSGSQLARLKHEFTENRYLTEKRRQQLSAELGLNEAQIKIWFQNKRAKLKKSSGTKNPLALQLMAQGLYNHSTVPLTREEEELQELQERENEAAAAAAAGIVSS